MLVLDVDGTVTNYGHPNDIPNMGFLKPRGNVVQFLQNMKALGVKVVLSSGWPYPSETVSRINTIGLGECLGTVGDAPVSVVSSYDLFKGVKVRYATKGKLACVDYPGFGQYFRSKAFAYKLVYKDLSEETISHVVFGDDGSENIDQFDREFKLLQTSYNLFTNATLKTFCLSLAEGGDVQ